MTHNFVSTTGETNVAAPHLTFPSDIITALIAFAGVIFSSVWATRYRLKKNQSEMQSAIERVSMTIGEMTFLVVEMRDEIKSIMEETELDRFMMFRANNGDLLPRYTTAQYQFHKEKDHKEIYFNFVMDDHYRSCMKTMETAGSIHLVTADLPPCRIRDVYETQGVTAAYWFFIGRRKVMKGMSTVSYCSFATHREGGFENNHVFTRAFLVVDQMKGLSRELGAENCD